MQMTHEVRRALGTHHHSPTMAALMVDELREQRLVLGRCEVRQPRPPSGGDEEVQVERNRTLLRGLLTAVGFEVQEAASGEEALERWQAWEPHLIWMDKRMPGIDGLETTRRIRAAEAQRGNGHTRILALSASALDHERDEILAAGCDDFLPKPFREESVLAKMREHLGLAYAYEEPRARRSAAVATAMTAHRLGAVPPPLIAQLRRALMQADTEEAVKVTRDLGGYDEPLAAELRGMIEEFRLDEVEAALDQLGPSTHP